MYRDRSVARIDRGTVCARLVRPSPRRTARPRGQPMAIFGRSTMKEAARYTRAAREVLGASSMKLLMLP